MHIHNIIDFQPDIVRLVVNENSRKVEIFVTKSLNGQFAPAVCYQVSFLSLFG